MKKKLTQFRWFVTMLLLVTAMAMPKMAWAQNQMYAELSSDTLTFKYGEKPTEGYEIPDYACAAAWKSERSSIKTVVFDESFKAIRPTTCNRWFYDCTSLTTINGIENLNTVDVTNMQNMFYNCSSLTTLDLSGFNTANVDNMNSMFFGCSELTTIYASSNFTTSAVTSSDDMFSGCTSLVGAVAYSSDKTNAEYANTTKGYFKNPGDCSAYAVFNSSNNSLTFKYDTNISQLAENEVLCTIKSDNQNQGWYNYCTSINKVVFEPSFASARPVTCYHWFYECSNLASIEGLEYLNTSEVKSMNSMFFRCTKITTLNLSDFETSQVTDMSYMFGACNALTTIYVSDEFTIDKVTSDTFMFIYCYNLKGASSFIEGDWNKSYANYHTGYFSYGINTVDDLKTFANKVNGTYTPAEGETATPYTAICAGLMANITLPDADSMPAIGSSGYSGTFDGCGHTISGLNFSSASSALFAQNSGTIKNLGIAEATIAEGANGNLCQTNEGTIKNCFFMGKTTGSSQGAGGICQTNNGTITNCYYLADSETDAIDGTTYKTTAQFKSGEVCYLLNEGKTDGTQIWYQNLAAEGDTWPVCNNTGNNTVYNAILFCGGTSNAGNTYANTPKVKIDHDMTGSVSLNPEQHIYQKVCKRDGCGEVVGYYATRNGSVEAKLEDGIYKVASFDLADANAYKSEAEFTVTSLAYKRKFYDDKWMAVYVPFAIDCSQLENDYEMATINNFHEYEQEDGTYNVVLEVKRVTKGGTIPALTPCLMRMKTAPAAEVEKTLTFENAEFSAAADKSIDCSSVTRYYQFFGTLNGKTGLTPATDFVLNAGKLYKTSENTVLLPQRWYLSATDRPSTPVEPTTMLRSISINVIGDGEATGIEDIHVNTESGADASGCTGIYDLQGRKINSEPTKGMYIKNGKKYIK